MNKELYNSLESAREFLVTVEKNEKDLLSRAEHIKTVYVDRYILWGKEKPKKFSWLKFYLLLCLDGIGIIYALHIYFHNRKAKKKQAELDKIANSYEITGKKRKEEQIREAKLSEYKKFYLDNYWNKLGFLPDWARKFETVDSISYRIEYIDGLIRYVRSGAKTLDEAMENYSRELRMIDALKKQREYQEHLDEQHKQRMDALNTIAKNQEKSNDELERMRRKYIDRW